MTEEHVQSRTGAATRLRFVLGTRAIDVAVPADVPLVDLLPAVLVQFGAETLEQGAEHEGWVLQRLGSDALDEDLTPRELDLNDGEALYLRPRGDQLTPIDYDDIVAGVGDQVRAHASAWTPLRTRGMLLAGATVALLTGVPLLVLAAPGLGAAAMVLALLMAALILVAATLLARGARDTLTGTVLSGVAAVHAGAAGALLPLGAGGTASAVAVQTCASAAAVATLAIGLALVADGALLFTAALTTTVTLVVTGLVGAIWSFPLADAAAIALALTVVAGLFVPSAAFRLSGLTLPLLPTEPEELAEDITPVPHRLVVDRGRATVGYSGSLHVGIGIAQVVLVVPVVTAGGWSTIYGAVVAVLLLLRARHPSTLLPRWSMLVPAGVALIAVPWTLVDGMSPLTALGALWFPCVAVGVLLVQLVDVMPGRRLRPYWGRAVDLLESATAIAMLPLLLQVLGVFGAMRALAS